MPVYDIAFYSILFFLSGVLVWSFNINFLITAFLTAFIAVLFSLIGYLNQGGIFKYTTLKKETISINKLFWLAVLSFIIIFGFFYASSYDSYLKSKTNIIFEKKIQFKGIVSENPERGMSQNFTVYLQGPYSGKVLTKIEPYPSFDYGDEIKFEGLIKNPEPKEYADYLKKDKIFGVSNFPKTELIRKNQGSYLKSFLYGIKNRIVSNFQKALPSESSAFLSGVTLGERGEFSKEFKDAMSKSGTTHLVALSGYNISIISMVVVMTLGWFFGRKTSFLLSILVILIFVLMTGAEASVVRAAIMGVIMILASQVGRLYSMRNAIVIAAFLMVLQNPKVLKFDIGFELSFIALLGIVYLMPAIKKIFRIENFESDILSWRENFFTTLSAQLAVAPILIMYFGNFSLVSIIANVLILGFIPLTMAFGFILGFIGFVSPGLAQIFAWFIQIILSYELVVIEFFGSINSWDINSLNIYLAFIYYLVLIVFIVFINFRNQKH